MATLTEKTRRRIRNAIGKRTTAEAVIAIAENKTGTLTQNQQDDVHTAFAEQARSAEFITTLHATTGGTSMSRATQDCLRFILCSKTATDELLAAMS